MPVAFRLGVFLLVVNLFLAIFGPWIAPYPQDMMMAGKPLQGASLAHPFGTDQLGRDIWQLAVAGTRSAVVGPIVIALGSMLIGLMLAAASTTAAGPISQSAYGARDVFGLLSPFLLVVTVVFVPALDMLLAIVRRTRAGRSPFSPDKMHLHHRLLQIGHSHRRAVLLIYLWVGLVALGAASSIFFDPRYTGAVLLAALAVAVVVTVIPLVRGENMPDDDELTALYDSLYDSK
jgi:ABC-type dipeptide/oligopeptide/nickel transport system permease subunit